MKELFENIESEPVTMSQNEFFNKAKSLIEKIENVYSRGWKNQALSDNEFPAESVCENCTGCGMFQSNGEERECFQNKSEGECYQRVCDYEQIGMELEEQLEDIYDLLIVDSIND